jgi:methenyltetrahydromethanopterin cyclohydrolase
MDAEYREFRIAIQKVENGYIVVTSLSPDAPGLMGDTRRFVSLSAEGVADIVTKEAERHRCAILTAMIDTESPAATCHE